MIEYKEMPISFDVKSDAGGDWIVIGRLKQGIGGFAFSACGTYEITAKTLRTIADKLDELNKE